MITQKELAKIFGVTRTTVARALNGGEGISDKTREDILKLANEMGYEKNYLGSSLAKKKKRTIIAILQKNIDIDNYLKLEEGLYNFKEKIKNYGINLKIYKVNSITKQCEILKQYLEKDIDTLIIQPIETLKINKILESHKKKIPVISIGKALNHSIFIELEQKKTGKVAANILSNMIDKNKKILIVDMELKKESNNKYLNGFCKRLEEDKIKYSGPIKIESLLENKSKILKHLSSDIEGIYFSKYSSELIEYITNNSEKDYKFITNEFNKKTEKMLKKKIITAIVVEDFYKQGYIAGEIAFEIGSNNTFEIKRKYRSDIKIYFNENLK